ncbi:MAG: sigma-70 family RNA polymerase sigma factor [Candidatus Symbiothrix sp.]|jgi:RNA polymerase sigma-70 factor (ECF subfamily)|nr:sigma-70 family RNA polymerase sigma factor [Candidatus Symbiothrix sp.]
MNFFFYFCKNIPFLFEITHKTKLSDAELLQRYKDSGNTEYFGELYNRYIPLLYGVCLKYLRNTDKAQDAVMQLFENLLPKMARQDIVEFRTWIYSVVKNHCLQLLRKDSHEIIIDSTMDIMESDEILHLLNEEENDGERKEALRQCLKKLPVQQRIAIIRFFMEEMSYMDIVGSTGYNLNQVKSYIQNGKRNLKICIEKNSL